MTVHLTDNEVWCCALDLTGLGQGPVWGRYKHCNVLFLYVGREFLSQLFKFTSK